MTQTAGPLSAIVGAADRLPGAGVRRSSNTGRPLERLKLPLAEMSRPPISLLWSPINHAAACGGHTVRNLPGRDLAARQPTEPSSPRPFLYLKQSFRPATNWPGYYLPRWPKSRSYLTNARAARGNRPCSVSLVHNNIRQVGPKRQFNLAFTPSSPLSIVCDTCSVTPHRRSPSRGDGDQYS